MQVWESCSNILVSGYKQLSPCFFGVSESKLYCLNYSWWSSVGYGVSAFHEAVTQNVVLYPSLLAVGKSPMTFVHVQSDRTILQHTFMTLVEHICREFSFSVFIILFKKLVWLVNFFNAHTFETFMTLCHLHKSELHLCLLFSWEGSSVGHYVGRSVGPSVYLPLSSFKSSKLVVVVVIKV